MVIETFSNLEGWINQYLTKIKKIHLEETNFKFGLQKVHIYALKYWKYHSLVSKEIAVVNEYWKTKSFLFVLAISAYGSSCTDQEKEQIALEVFIEYFEASKADS